MKNKLIRYLLKGIKYKLCMKQKYEMCSQIHDIIKEFK